MATNSENNSYVRDGMLYITPTLTSDVIGGDAIVQNGYVYNISGCTYNITQGITYTSSVQLPTNVSAIGSAQPFDADAYAKACSAVANSTSGSIINPVMSARISTRKTASIKYGRVEVRAKIPTGYVIQHFCSVFLFTLHASGTGCGLLSGCFLLTILMDLGLLVVCLPEI